MNDPFGRSSQPLTDALLQLDQAISLAESNVVAAQQAGLPEAPDLAARLPLLTFRARQFLASVPDMTQPQRWGEGRRLLDQARAFQPLFAPYLMLGNRVAAAKQAQADMLARQRAAAEAARRAQQMEEASTKLETARRRFSSLRQTLADMQVQRGPGYDDAAWQDSLRSVASMIVAQDVRLSAAAASARDGAFDQAQAQLDQALGELQAAQDLAQRARVAAGIRAQQAAASSAAGGVTGRMPDLSSMHTTPHTLVPPHQAHVPPPGSQVPPLTPTAAARTLLLIESRTGTLFRCDGRPTLIGRGLDAPQTAADSDLYLNLSRACDPGEAEYLGVSRRHAEIARQQIGFMVRDLNSTNGTRLRHAGEGTWETLQPQQWMILHEGDTLQFGLLECTVSLT